jgi:sugar (pentulose or hexulose) kinase
VREAGDALGRLTRGAADATGLSEGLAVCVGLGDNQASFLGSVADLRETVLVNVGTGAQVACHADEVGHGPEVETRPFARSGYLLVHAMLSGGKAYALLEEFLRRVGSEVLGVEASGEVYEKMEALAEGVPPGCDGMRCDPSFAGSRWDAEKRGCWSGVSETNLTPGHVIRALLEGMARSLKEGWERLEAAGAGERTKLVGAGNGVRENGLLVRMIEAEFGKAMQVPTHKEEAAYGAALVAGYAAGVWESVGEAARVVRYE